MTEREVEVTTPVMMARDGVEQREMVEREGNEFKKCIKLQ